MPDWVHMSKDSVMQNDFDALLKLIHLQRQKAYSQINTTLIELYWQIGEYISNKVKSASWGKSVVSELARYINENDPGIKGFSDKNLWRMKQFFETYHENEKLSPLVRELPWSHNLTIFSRCKTDAEREFYIKMVIENKLSKRELERQIDSAYFERAIFGSTKLSPVLRESHFGIGHIFKDNYVLEFLGLPETHNENEVKRSLVRNMKNFILELGKDFIFISEEYRLQVGNQDFYIDLLFFHRELSALIAFELKIGKFKPDHLGQLNFYLEALDRDVKKAHENPSIGILLCRDKDDEVVEYALSRNLSPALIAEYQLKLPDKKLIREKLHELLIEQAWEEKDE